MNRFFLILSVLATLSACQAPNNVPTGVSSQPAAYQIGYTDGCGSGKNALGNPHYQFQKNAKRFIVDKMYQQGWEDGFSICKASYEGILRSMR